MGFYTEEAIKEKSRNFIENIDRSVLGRFAVPEMSLFWFDVLKRNKFESISSLLDQEVESRAGRKVDELVTDRESLNELLVEWFFWWETAGTHRMREWVATTTLRPEAFARLEFITMIAASPISYHDYFAVGMRDVKLIEQCVADGIDAELAAVMER